MTIGSVEPLKGFHSRWNGVIQVLEVMVREAHPGSAYPAHHSYEQKMNEARAYKESEGIPWPVLVDDLEGTVHQVYGGLSDPSYLIDREGRVAFCIEWTHIPSLHRAVELLLARDGTGVVKCGIDRRPHMMASMVNGWPALERGYPESFIDMERAAPGVARAVRAGRRLRPALAPVALRATPLPPAARLGIGVGGFLMAVKALRPHARRGRDGRRSARH